MGQAHGAWCGEKNKPALDDLADDAPLKGRTTARGGANGQRPSVSASTPPPAVERLLAECPRELASALRQTAQWDALRVKPWLSPGGWMCLQRSLQRCCLPRLVDCYRDSELSDEYKYTLPPVIPWNELDADHVISAGQVFRRDDANREKLWQLRKLGMQVIRQGKLGVVFFAGGANLRLHCVDTPAACSRRVLRLNSGKSMFQVLSERVRRIAQLAEGAAPAEGAARPRPSIPVFIMTSRVTHRAIVEHFEAHKHFGLPARDVFFFEQQVTPVLSNEGRLLPQSMGGEFAQSPGGTGQLFLALTNSSALEQMRDRGVECLHAVGVDNLLARVADPFFIGFCRELDVDCACKITERSSPDEDLEVFCVRQSPVTTRYADIEEAACGLAPCEVPQSAVDELIEGRAEDGSLSYCGSINSFFVTVSYVEEVVARPVPVHRCERIVPYLDFYLQTCQSGMDLLTTEMSDAAWDDTAAAMAPVAAERPKPQPKSRPVPAGSPRAPSLGGGPGDTKPNDAAPFRGDLELGSWPAENAALELAGQSLLRSAAAQLLAGRDASDEERTVLAPLGEGEPSPPPEACDAWRCDVNLDARDASQSVRVLTAARGPLTVPQSLRVVDGGNGGERWKSPLRCSLVVPLKPNAVVLESFLLDYFAYTDRAVAFEVARSTEFAPVRCLSGAHSPERARAALSALHRGWLTASGARLVEERPGACLEVSPLLSYEGEGLEKGARGITVRLPRHLPSFEEAQTDNVGAVAADETAPSVAEEGGDGLDTRTYYLQEYAQRPKLSSSSTPQFRTPSRDTTASTASSLTQVPGMHGPRGPGRS